LHHDWFQLPAGKLALAVPLKRAEIKSLAIKKKLFH
jgi:hypothetical protein